jgi:toxin ParE1/3/4
MAVCSFARPWGSYGLGGELGYAAGKEDPGVQVKWTIKAVGDLQALRAFIAKDKLGAAKKPVQKIFTKVEKDLALQPHLGRPGRAPGTREFIIADTPYILPYRVQEIADSVARPRRINALPLERFLADQDTLDIAGRYRGGPATLLSRVRQATAPGSGRVCPMLLPA